MSKDGCLLNRSDISVVSENDHRVGLCLCKFCTCGSHQCPSSSRRPQTPVNMYATSYKHSYAKKVPVTVAKPKEQPVYRKDERKMDLETSNMREYRTFVVERPREEVVRSSTPTLRFTSCTSYAADFPNWGCVDSNIERRPQLPVRADEVKFMGRSMYQTNFSEQIVRSQTPTPSIRPKTSTLHMTPPSDEVRQTTAQTSFRPFSKDHMSKIVKRPAEEYTKLAASPLHFVSSHRANYQARPAEFKDPRLVRRQIVQSRIT